ELRATRRHHGCWPIHDLQVERLPYRVCGVRTACQDQRHSCIPRGTLQMHGENLEIYRSRGSKCTAVGRCTNRCRAPMSARCAIVAMAPSAGWPETAVIEGVYEIGSCCATATICR